MSKKGVQNVVPRNHTLDTLRAFAILMVLTTHTSNHFFRGSDFAKAVSVGGRGVDLFFVLSGWLLGSQLFRERQTTGTVNIRRFWLRRWLRTLPAYYAIVLATFAQFMLKGESAKLDAYYLVFVQNYYAVRQYLGITWSLCVEEHFYLLIAPLIWLGGRYRGAVALTLLAALALFAIHILGYYHHDTTTYLITETHIVWQQCALGVTLAWLATHRPQLWERLLRFAVPLTILSLILIAVAIVNRTVWNWWLPDWGTGGWALIFGTWILLANSTTWWREHARVPPLSFVATRAYALYLTHIEALAIAKKLPLPVGLQLLATIVLVFVAAELLYRMIERPFNKLRERI